VVAAGNEAAAALTSQGVNAIVVLIHEGGTTGSDDPNGCDVRGPIVDVANGLSTDIDVIVSGHTHRSYICTIGTKLVTSALSLGRVITDIDLTIDRRSGEVVSKRARNEIVTRDRPKRAAMTALLDHYRPFASALGMKPVGTITTGILRSPDPDGESALGDIVADAYLDAGRAVDAAAVAALTNSGGIRADLIGQAPTPPGGPRLMRYADAFDALPFGNVVIVKTMTGEGLLRWLEQQFDNPGPGSDRMLQVSGLAYRYTRTKPAGQRIDRATLMIGGRPLVSTRRYRVVSTDFVWNGGDAFTAAQAGTDPVAAGVDVDALVAYLGKYGPVGPGRQDRISKQP
jgi:5'-nucleotidase